MSVVEHCHDMIDACEAMTSSWCFVSGVLREKAEARWQEDRNVKDMQQILENSRVEWQMWGKAPLGLMPPGSRKS